MSKPKTIIKRSKKGCFTCRQRRKACDQIRPICSGCKRNLLACEWPQYENQTLREFNARKAQLEEDQSNTSSVRSDPTPKSPLQPVEPSYKLSTSSLDDFYHENRNSVQKILILRDTSLENYLAEENFLDIVFGRLISKIAPKKIQQKLSRHLIDLMASSEAILKATVCLGSSYILNRDGGPYNKIVSDTNYQEALIELQRIFKDTGEDEVDLLALNAIVILTVREQNVGLGTHEVLKHLRALYFLINKRISKEGELNLFSFLLAVDAFLYHYSTNLLFYLPTQIDVLPDPFLLEKQLNLIYGYYTAKNDDTNPILSSSYDSFIISSQACYLYRQSTNPGKKACLAKILLLTIRRMLHHSLDLASYTKLRYHATNIVLHKIIDHEVSHKSPTIQAEVNAIISCIPSVDLDWYLLLSSWSLFLCGLCCCKTDDRNVIRVLFLRNSSDGLMNSEQSIINFLEYVWSEDIGLNIIDLTDTLGTVSLM